MPRLRPYVLAALAVTFVTIDAADAHAQTPIEIRPRAATITVGGRLHSQLQASSVDGADTDVFIRRARLRLDVRINDFIDARVNPDFSGGTATLQDAYVRLAFSDAFRVSVGQFKRAFSAFELASSTDLPVIERDGRIAGLDVCPGVSGVCSFSRLTGKLAFDGRDQGVRVDGRLGGGFSYMATVTNGEGPNAGDVNDSKSVSGRLVYGGDGFELGAFAGVHDRSVGEDGPEEDTDYSPAAGVDLEIGTWRSGFHLIAAAAVGDNWKVGGEPGFTVFQALASYHVGLDAPRLDGVEPVVRLGWADPDGDAEDDAGLLLTPGVMLWFQGKNGLSFNLDVYAPGGDAETDVSFKAQTYLYF